MLSIEITMSKTPEEILELIRKTHRGPKGISDLLGGQITPQAVSQWKRVPPAWCIPACHATKCAPTFSASPRSQLEQPTGGYPARHRA
jgi:hypothetical protein